MAGKSKASISKNTELHIEDVIAQGAIAFGQGAGSMNISRGAGRLLRKFFDARFEHHLRDWNKNRLGILAYARGLGWYAAVVAQTNKRVDIGKVDIREAIMGFPCPIVPQLLDQKGPDL